MRIKIIKSFENYNKGQVLQMSSEKASKLINEGIAIASKDMTGEDYKQTGIKSKPRRIQIKVK